MRRASWLIDGVRQGQPLGALLGYRFERALHENRPRLDHLIPWFRRIAPLAVQAPPAESEGAWKVAVEMLPANNVVDGLALLRKWKAPQGDALAIPWGTAGLLPGPGTTAYIACNRELKNLDDAVDAMGDLAVAESVHQLVQGNPVRAGATLESIAEGEAPSPELDIIRTPRTGTGITHRIAVAFGAPPTGTPVWGPRTPRAQAEPFLNAWVTQLFGPAAAGAKCRVEYLHPVTGAALMTAGENPQPQRIEPTLGELSLALNLAPIDLVYLPEGGSPGQRSELEQRIVYHARKTRPGGVPANAGIRLTFSRDPWPAGTLSFAEILEVAHTVRRLITGARPLTARDLAPPDQPILETAEADTAPPGEAADSPLRLGVRAQTAVNDFTAAVSGLETALAGSDATRLSDGLMRLGAFGIPGAVPVLPVEDTSESIAALRTQAKSIKREADDRLARVTALQSAYDTVTDPSSAATRDHHVARLREVFGPDFVVLSRFTPANAPDLGRTFAASDALQGGDPLKAAAITWFQRVARVRDGAARLDAAMLYAEALGGAAFTLSVGQLPYVATELWVALPRTSAPPPGSRLSLVVHAPAGLAVAQPLAGLLVDEWVEVIPNDQETTGLSFHFDAPGARAPQAILLAVAPDGGAEWTLESLEATVLETLELAKLRAVDLTALADIGQFLPALYFAHNPAGDTVATDFARVAGLATSGS